MLVVFYNHFHANSLGIVRAQTPLVESICKQAESYEFCCSTFSSHLRTSTSDLHGLALISIAETIEHVRDICDRLIPQLLVSNYINSVGKQRIKICQSDYNESLEKFFGAFASSSRRSYWEVIDWVRDGANKAIDCEDVYRRYDPISVSPISADNHKVIKLVEITLIVVQPLVTFV
ncbi:hypothetical protein FNV43_RR23668 [Rhamnella rubrinervis]|uniref:Pectinesterase inhibitor domain-containing protein n=1 Tax=Rhamnella rubrinervis TaxID=2594499 RepID=A0A8K0DXJ5_9ROSA|nr:hypothetical protein FNV43_RR23668 [Rhamnella rubrinervis]